MSLRIVMITMVILPEANASDNIVNLAVTKMIPIRDNDRPKGTITLTSDVPSINGGETRQCGGLTVKLACGTGS